MSNKEITTHGAALRLAIRVMNDELERLQGLPGYMQATGNRAADIIKNFEDAIYALDEMQGEEYEWEEENGYRVGERFYPNGDAPEEDV